MGATGQGALIGLSNMITARAEREKQRELALEDEQRQNQSKMIDAAIASGNLNPDQIQAALDQKKKLYPKEVHPLIDKFGEVLGKVFHIKNQQAQATTNPVTQVPGSVPPSGTGQDATSPQGVAQEPTGNAPPASPVAATATNSTPATPSAPDSSMAAILATANPNPVVRAKTAAQAQLAGNEVIQSDKRQRAQKLIDDMKAAGTLTPQAEQAIRMEGEGFAVPPALMRPVMGKQMQPDVKDGVLMGVKNPETNEYYTDPKTMPPEAKAIWDQATKGLADKSSADEAKQQRTFDHQMAMHEKAVQDSIKVGNYREARKAVNAAQSTVDDAIDRMKTMDQNLVDLVQTTQAGHPNQQAALSLVANHIGMTLGLQKGARITKAVWDEAQASAPWLSRIGAKWSDDGYLTGLNITPEQGKQMVALAHQRVQTIRDRADRVRQEYADDLPSASSAVPPKMKAAPKKAAGKIVVTPEDMKNAGVQ